MPSTPPAAASPRRSAGLRSRSGASSGVSFRSPLRREHVTLPAARVDQLGRKLLVDLVAEVSDVNVNHVARNLVVLVVDVFPYVGARDDLVAAVGQVLKQSELSRAELDGL